MEFVAKVEVMDMAVTVTEGVAVDVEIRLHVIALTMARRIICLISAGTSVEKPEWA